MTNYFSIENNHGKCGKYGKGKNSPTLPACKPYLAWLCACLGMVGRVAFTCARSRVSVNTSPMCNSLAHITYPSHTSHASHVTARAGYRREGYFLLPSHISQSNLIKKWERLFVALTTSRNSTAGFARFPRNFMPWLKSFTVPVLFRGWQGQPSKPTSTPMSTLATTPTRLSRFASNADTGSGIPSATVAALAFVIRVLCLINSNGLGNLPANYLEN